MKKEDKKWWHVAAHYRFPGLNGPPEHIASFKRLGDAESYVALFENDTKRPTSILKKLEITCGARKEPENDKD